MNDEVRRALEDAEDAISSAENALDEARDALSTLRALATGNALEPGAPNPTAERKRLEEWNRFSRPEVQT